MGSEHEQLLTIDEIGLLILLFGDSLFYRSNGYSKLKDAVGASHKKERK